MYCLEYIYIYIFLFVIEISKFTANSCRCLALCVIFYCAALQISQDEYIYIFFQTIFFQIFLFSCSQNFFFRLTGGSIMYMNGLYLRNLIFARQWYFGVARVLNM